MHNFKYLLVGNGLDLAHNKKTSYMDFFKLLYGELIKN